MANQTITQLPMAGALAGTESVPIVQNGQTVQTTVSAIATSPSTNYSFLTATSEPLLTDSRQLSTSGTGLSLTDNGAGANVVLALSGAPASLIASGTGIQVKTNASTLTGRSIQAGTAGLSVANGDGIAGNPSVSLTGMPLYLAQSTGVGLLTRTSGNSVGVVTLQGTANEIDVADGTGDGANPTIGIATNPTLPGTGYVLIPKGTTAERPGSPQDGMIRFNTDSSAFEVYESGGWSNLPGGAVTQINTGPGLTGGPITTTGTISVAETGVVSGTYGSTTSVGRFTVSSRGLITYADELAISAASIGAVTSVVGTANEITSSGGGAPQIGLAAAIDFSGKTLTSGSLNPTILQVGGVTAVTESGTQTLTNKTIDGLSNTLTNLPAANIAGTLAVGNGGTGLNTYVAGDLIYANGSASIARLGIGTATYLLTSSGSAPQWTDPATIAIGTASAVANAVTFTNTGGAAAGTTFNGSAARTIDYSTLGAPKADGTGASGTWGIGISGNAATATTATNVTGGAAGSLVYQTGAATTSTLALGTQGYVLRAGASAPEWAAIDGGTF